MLPRLDKIEDARWAAVPKPDTRLGSQQRIRLPLS